MIEPSQLSLFSLKAQVFFLNKYAVLITETKMNNRLLKIYLLKRTYFHIYMCFEKKTILKITPSNKILFQQK